MAGSFYPHAEAMEEWQKEANEFQTTVLYIKQRLADETRKEFTHKRGRMNGLEKGGLLGGSEDAPPLKRPVRLLGLTDLSQR